MTRPIGRSRRLLFRVGFVGVIAVAVGSVGASMFGLVMLRGWASRTMWPDLVQTMEGRLVPSLFGSVAAFMVIAIPVLRLRGRLKGVFGQHPD